MGNIEKWKIGRIAEPCPSSLSRSPSEHILAAASISGQLLLLLVLFFSMLVPSS
jgi:hypothetical protein